jgi:hypothetical protein
MKDSLAGREPHIGRIGISYIRRRVVPRRKYMHWYGYIDPQRTWRARIAIGELWRPPSCNKAAVRNFLRLALPIAASPTGSRIRLSKGD